MLRYKITVLFILLISICTFNFVEAGTNELPLLGKVIYLDPGHGGLDPGAMYKNIKEKNINLQISKNLEKRLTKLGAIVYLTRYDDYDLSVNNTINRKRSDLSRRGNIINKSDCDLFLSIHLNAENTGIWKGAQTFYNTNNKENKKIAELLQQQFKEDLNSKRKAKNKNDLYLQKRINRPGVLIEVGFLSNASERYLLKQEKYQDKVTLSIANALLKYFK
jgi:N-acetylmuramoyl-L-alanine amidase